MAVVPIVIGSVVVIMFVWVVIMVPRVDGSILTVVAVDAEVHFVGIFAIGMSAANGIMFIGPIGSHTGHAVDGPGKGKDPSSP